jgi:hypothetical protein
MGEAIKDPKEVHGKSHSIQKNRQDGERRDLK